MSISNSIKSADFKTEKHVPTIHIISKEDNTYVIEVAVGKEVAHPNTTEHFIGYIDLYFQTSGAAISHLGRVEFLAHGESTQGANQGAAYTEPVAMFKCTLKQPGTLHAISYCNIHGLWESKLDV